MPVAQLGTDWAPASSLSVWSAPLVKVGASLTELTVMLKAVVEILPPFPSETVKVKLSEVVSKPLWR